MALTLTVDLETLTSERAQQIAGFIVAFAENSFEAEPPAILTDPALVFGNIRSSEVVVEIPNPTSAGTVAQPISAAIPDASIDKSGLPWDGRIHANTKSLNADGTWRGKRGVADALVTTVTGELRKLMAIPSPGPQLVAPAPPPPQQAPLPPAADTQKAYIDLFGRVSATMSAGKLTDEQLKMCLESIGVPSLPLLGARLDLVPTACNLIDAVIAGTSA